MISFYKEIIEIQQSNKKAILCTIINTKGSTPRKIGAKMIVYANGKIKGSIGGGALEQKVTKQAIEALQNNKPLIVKHNLVNELAMCCGGTVELFLEPIMNIKKLYIFGAGHIGKSLAKFAVALNFSVFLIDERYEVFEDETLNSIQLIKSHHKAAIQELNFDENTFIVIATHKHDYDREIMALTATQPHQYIGMIGSKRKVSIAKKNLMSSKIINERQLNAIDMPIGININAITPEEIAISILAKIINVRNNDSKVSV